MAFLTDAIQWIENIYELATTDKVLGGKQPAGISNRQAQELANRTAFLLDLCDKLQDQLDTVHPIGEVQALAAPAYNAADYDATGLGKPGTSGQHWALCNGVNGTVNLAGRSPIGLDPNSLDYAQPDATGGRDSITLTSGDLPKTALDITARITDGNPNSGDGAPTFTAATTTSPKANGKAIAGTVGSNTPNALDIRPKYSVLIYRQRISN